MIVRILSASATFNGVNYNTNKIDTGKGELMQASNFGALQGLDQWKPEDYKNYFKMISALNRRVKGPQFHAVISAKGKEYSKSDLTQIAVQWLDHMGYGKQPFLIVYHKDTGNNHVHIVSTRIGRDGKKINSGFENIRAINSLNKVIGLDERHTAQDDLRKALAYRFATKAQFMMIMEAAGYVLKENGPKLKLIKFGKKQAELDLGTLESAIQHYVVNEERKAQLKAIFRKYANSRDTSLIPLTVPSPGNYHRKTKGFTSDFAAFLKQEFGIEMLFHASGDKMPYGYSVIDHKGMTVFKGGDIMSLKELLAVPVSTRSDIDVHSYVKKNPKQLTRDEYIYYAAILRVALFNYPDLGQGLFHLGLTITRNVEGIILSDPAVKVFIDCRRLLNETEYSHLLSQIDLETGIGEEVCHQSGSVPDIFIADDMDDEAVHGRKRRRRSMDAARGR